MFAPANHYVVRLARKGFVPRAIDKLSGGEGSYRVEVAGDSITIIARSPANLLGAVYELLESQGCSWLYPGPEGEGIPHKERLSFPCGTRQGEPDFSMRGMYSVENLQRYSPRDVAVTLDWMAKNRLNYVTVPWNYGYARLGKLMLQEARKRDIQVVAYLWSFDLFLPLEIGKEHPEYFSLVTDIEHAASPAAAERRRLVDHNVKRCASSRQAIQLYVDNGIKFFRRTPGDTTMGHRS